MARRKVGAVIKTLQQLQAAQAKGREVLEKFLIDTIDSHPVAALNDLEKIYESENPALTRLKIRAHVGDGENGEAVDLTPERKKYSGFGKIGINHMTSRLWDNPVQISLAPPPENEHPSRKRAREKAEREKIKNVLGENFHDEVKEQAKFAAIHGVSWDYVLGNELFKASEFVPFADDWSGDIEAGVRFWQTGGDKDAVIYVQLYEMDGITTYKRKDSKLIPLDIKRNEVGAPVKAGYFNESPTESSGQGYKDTNPSRNLMHRLKEFPVVPYYFNPSKKTEFSNDVRESITFYEIKDTIYSDRAIREPNVRYTVSGYGGDLKKIADIVRVSQVTGVFVPHKADEGTRVDAQAFELPHESHSKLMDAERGKVFEWFQIADPDKITGAGMREIAVRLTMAREDAKMGDAETCARQYIKRKLAVHGLIADRITFVHKKPSDDKQTSDIITAMLPDLAFEYRVRLCPAIPQEMAQEIIEYQEAFIAGQTQKDIEEYERLLKEAQQDEENQD